MSCMTPKRCMGQYQFCMVMGMFTTMTISQSLQFCLRRDGTSGIFVNNAAEMWVEITNKDEDADIDQASALFMVDSGAFDLFVLLGPSPAAAASQYVSLTGVPHLPPVSSTPYS